MVFIVDGLRMENADIQHPVSLVNRQAYRTSDKSTVYIVHRNGYPLALINGIVIAADVGLVDENFVRMLNVVQIQRANLSEVICKCIIKRFVFDIIFSLY